MKKITFYNSTPLDPMSFKVMGLSVKEDSNAIGMFGTGLKYAIATTLRLGDKISIISGDDIYCFDTVDISFRGAKKSLVCCNGEELGFTTDMGILWEPWMAYREFFCNALDEGGDVTNGDCDAHTQVIVEGEMMAKIYSERHSYFLKGKTPIWSNDFLEVYRGRTHNAFYKGVCVGALQRNSARFTFNLKSGLTLTEDRTIQFGWSFGEKVAREILKCEDSEIVNAILKAPAASFEGSLDFCTANPEDASERIRKAMELLFAQGEAFSQPNLDSIYKVLNKEAFEPKEVEMSDRQKRQVKSVLSILERAGYIITTPIKYFDKSNDRQLGQAKNGEIHLFPAAFERGTFELAATILEEHAHIATGHSDFSRGLQDWLLRQIMIQIEERFDICI